MVAMNRSSKARTISGGGISCNPWRRFMWRDDAYLLDMLLAAHKVQEFTRNVTQEQFQGDELTQNGVMRQIQIIGEAARKVSPQC